MTSAIPVRCSTNVWLGQTILKSFQSSSTELQRLLGSRDGTEVIAPVSHQYGPGLIPACLHRWIEFLAFFRRFFSGFSGFSPGAQVFLRILRVFSGFSGFSPGTQVFLRVLRFFSGCSGFSPGSQVFLRVLRFFSGFSGFSPGAQVFLRVLSFFSGCAGFSPGSQLFLRVLRFFSGSVSSGFPPSKQTNILKFHFDQDGRTAWKPAEADVACSLTILNLFYPLFLKKKTRFCTLVAWYPNKRCRVPFTNSQHWVYTAIFPLCPGKSLFRTEIHWNCLRHICATHEKYRLYLRWDTVPLDAYWVRVCRCCTWWFGGDTRVNAGRVLERALARSADRWSMLLRERPRAAMGDRRDPGVLDATAWRESTENKNI